MKALSYIEIDIPYCSLSYGVAPCTAAVGVTGDDKCFNTRATCQDLPHYTETEVTLRFGVDAFYRPVDIDCAGFIDNVDFTPSRVALADGLGERAVLKVTLRDHPHSDTGQGFDKYVSERAYDPYRRGTLFGKLRARQPYLVGRALRWYQGALGDDLADMEVRHFRIDSFDGPTPQGLFTIVAKDVLTLLDGERAQAPTLSNGYLTAAIAADVEAAALSPAGIGDDEYATTDYAVIGGNEICKFYRDPSAGNDANTYLLISFDGASGSFAFTDRSQSGRTITRVGNAQVSDALPKFGSGCLLLDGNNDYLTVPNHADFTPPGDFTIDAWIRASSLDVEDNEICTKETSLTNGYFFTLTKDGAIKFRVMNSTTLVTLQSANGLIVVDTWYHVAIVRHGNVFTIYIDGVSRATATAAITIPTNGGAFRIGAGDGNGFEFDGSMDELRYSKVARWTANFTPPDGPYQSSTDALILVRGQLGTEASAHDAEDRVQSVLHFDGASPSTIIQTLERDYGGVPEAYIPIDDWDQELGAYLGQGYTAFIAEPTPVKQLVEELLEQAGLIHFWDDLAQTLQLRVLRQLVSDTSIELSARSRLAGSYDSKEQHNKRISRVQTYYGMINPLKSPDDLDNYRSALLTVDDESEAAYGEVAIRVVKSRWIPQFAASTAARLNDILLVRYKAPPRSFTFQIMRGEHVPALAGSYDLTAQNLQDASGDAETVQVQITRLNAGPALIDVEAEEVLLTGVVNSDPNNHIITLDNNVANINLRTLHDGIYPDAVSGQTVTCIVSSNVIVRSSYNTVPAFDSGDWPAGVTVILVIYGRIQGKGGGGGRGGSWEPSNLIAATSGTAGGTALKLRAPVSIDGTGEILGGGGGGGGGGPAVAVITGIANSGGGGGGGQGASPGLGGAKRSDGKPGQDGTTEAAGAYGNGAKGGFRGGNGGAAGQAGSGGIGSSSPGGFGGAAGKAIDGDSYVTEIGSVTITGPRV